MNVPTLIIHGDKDNTVPIKASSDKLAKMLPDAIYTVYEDAPHGLFYTHKEQLNEDLVSFITTGELKNKQSEKMEDIPVGELSA